MYHILEDTYSFDFDATWRTIRKEGHIIDCHGYNKMFLTSATGLAASSDDTLSDDLKDAKKSRIITAFKKNQRNKKDFKVLNKRIH